MRVTGPSELTFPDYDGNGMFKSLGNIRVNPSVGLLFIVMGRAPPATGQRRGERHRDDPSMRDFTGPIARASGSEDNFPNCPRYFLILLAGPRRIRAARGLRTARAGLEAAGRHQG